MFEEYTEEYFMEQAREMGQALEVDTRQGSVYMDAATGHCLRAAKFYNDLGSMFERLFIDTCTGEVLDERASEKQIYRKQATPAYYNAVFEGVEAADMVGDRFMTDGYYFTLASYDGGYYLQSEINGSEVNFLLSGRTLVPVRNTMNLTSATLGELYIAGTDQETDDDLRERYKAAVQALEFERNYKVREECNLDMTFENFFKLYSEDIMGRLKRNTWLTKEHIIRTKILPYFQSLKMNEISASDVLKWQNEMIAYRDENGVGYSETYRKTMHNQLSCLFNHACRYYNLKSNPARKAGCMGKEESKEMLFWTKEEYKKFSEAIMDKEISFYSFEMLYWTGIRLGELLALTMEDFDFTKNTVRINKSYQRLEKQDLVTTPKTPKSKRTIKLPKFLVEEMKEYFAMLYGYEKTDRIFPVTKSYLHHEMERGSKLSKVKKIRIHDLRHSHISLLIDMGFSAVAIADRVGHESIDITYRYAHLFPSKQIEMADKLDLQNMEMEEDFEEQEKEDF